MELSKYVGKCVKVDLKNGFYYLGVVKSADENSLSLVDKNKKLIDISEEHISFIREVKQWTYN